MEEPLHFTYILCADVFSPKVPELKNEQEKQ